MSYSLSVIMSAINNIADEMQMPTAALILDIINDNTKIAVVVDKSKLVYALVDTSTNAKLTTLVEVPPAYCADIDSTSIIAALGNDIDSFHYKSVQEQAFNILTQSPIAFGMMLDIHYLEVGIKNEYQEINERLS